LVIRALLRGSECGQIHRVVNNVMNWDNDSDDGVTRFHQLTVETFTHHLAVTHAMADGSPRLIARQTTMFLATPTGEVWQVFDSDAISWIDGGLPRNDPDAVARIFVRAGGGRTSRIYRFGVDESRSVTAWRMLEQLERAMVGDDQAA
jgi:hypothetical protein